MQRKYLVLLAAAPLAALAGPSVTGGCGCGGNEIPDAGSDAHADALSKLDAGLDAAEAATDAPLIPCSVPGYILDDAYDVSCGFCYASSTSVLPPPIAWEACGPSAIPAGMVCEQMVEDWPIGQGPFGGEYISQIAPTWVQQDGTVTIAVTRAEGDTFYRLVADADGPVHQAIIETSPSCTLGTYDLRDGRVVYRVYDSETAPLSSYGGGAYGADIGQLRPRVLTHYHNDTADDRSYYVSALGFFEAGTKGMYVNQYDWTTGALLRTIDSAALDNGFGIAHVWPRFDAVFWDAYSGTTYNKLRVWTYDAGASDLISYPNDPTQGASNFGTDGVDMVWQRGSGRNDGGNAYPINDVMKSPYASSAATVQGVRVRSAGTSYGTSPFIVGCGYAVNDQSIVPNQVGLLLVRLNDGYSWPLTGAFNGPWIWEEPLALTCTELFATVRVRTGDSGKNHATIARVRLDSLGPGTPPD